MSQAILPVFSKLWASDANVRIAYSAQLVAHCKAAQSQYDPEEAGQRASTTGVADEGLASDVAYSLKRLIRGLASPRESSRLGFAVALTELLSSLQDVTPSQVFPLLMQSSQLASNLRGSEERDLLFARMFGMHAIVSSGLIFRPFSSLHDWRVAIEEVLELGNRKIWLRESAGWVVHAATAQLIQQKNVPWREDGLQAVIGAALTGQAQGKPLRPLDWTPERLALVLLLQEANVTADWDSILKPTFTESNVLSPANLQAISRILNNQAAQYGQKGPQSSTSLFGNGQLHYVWRELSTAYFGSNESSTGKKQKKASTAQSDKIPFADLYKTIVDEGLLGATAALSSKYTGLQAVSLFLQTASADVIPQLISSNFLRTLVNHLSKADRNLHTLAKQTAVSISAAVKKHPAVGYEVLMKLYAKPYGNTRFDALTRTKTVEDVVAALDEDGTKRYASWLMEAIIAGDQSSQSEEDDDAEAADATDEDRAKSIESQRVWAMDQLLLLVRKHVPQIVKDDDTHTAPSWALSILQFFILHGFFILEKPSKKSSIEIMRMKPEQALSPTAQKAFRSRFLSCLTHLVTTNVRCRGQYWTSKAIEACQAFEKDSKHVRSLTPEGSAQERAKVLAAARKAAPQASADQSKALFLLSDILVLQAYDPEETASELLEQLGDAIDALYPAKSAKTNGKKVVSEEDAEEGEEAEPISILIDLFVNLLQKPATLLRTTAERVFAAYSDKVSEQAINLLLDQISPGEAEEVEEMEEDEEENEDDEEQAPSNKGKKRAAEDSEDESDDDEDEDEDDDLGIDLDADPELRAKVEEALKSMGLAPDEDEDDEDDEESEKEAEAEDAGDQLLNDDQMMELDEQLAEIFRSRKNAANEQRSEQQNSLNARLRILDLLAIFAKQQSASPLVLLIILPLFNIARKSAKEEDEFASKANRTLRGIVSKPKEYPSVDDCVPVLEVLSAIHAAARRAPNAEISQLANAASLYLSRVILTESGERHVADVNDVYAATFLDYISRKQSRVQPSLITSYIQRFKAASWPLQDAVISACESTGVAKGAHKRMQCFTFLQDLLSAHASLKTNQARKDVFKTMPSIVKMFTSVLKAPAVGEDTQLAQPARIKDILKSALHAARVSKTCSPSPDDFAKVWSIETLDSLIGQLTSSSHIEKAASLAALGKQLLAVIHPDTSSEKPSKRPQNSEKAAEASAAAQKKSRKRRTQ